MEYHLNSNKDLVDSKGNVQVAYRIFERGMEKFGDELDFVLRYLNFLITINDSTSESGMTYSCIAGANIQIDAHALFEHVISNFPGEGALGKMGVSVW